MNKGLKYWFWNIPQVPTCSGFVSVILITFIPGTKTLQLYPMFTAVSTLSPVRTHNLIPASARFDIVSATFSWMTPRISISLSISSAASSSSSFLFPPTEVEALSYFA
eukprot:1342006-Amorphochlora_amoeboformis.AAC.1